MSPWMIAIMLRQPALAILLMVVVWPVAWLLYRVIPNGRLKVVLFKVRTGKTAGRRDKVVMTAAVVAGYAVLIAFVGLLISRGG